MEVTSAPSGPPPPEVPAEVLSWRQQVVVRFGVTLGATVARAVCSFAAGIIVARHLGASRYGDLVFLLGSFGAISVLVDLGSSQAFYTLLSRRPRGTRFFALYYSWFLGIQLVASLVVVALVLPEGVVSRLWQDHRRADIAIAMATSFLATQGWGTIVQLGEAARRTLEVQALGVAQAMVHVGLLLLAVRGQWLTVVSVLLLMSAEYLLILSVALPRLVRANRVEGQPDSTGEIVREFGQYCAPLVLYAVVSFVYVFVDRWLLQTFGGAAEQGFFGISQLFSNVSLLATGALLNIFWTEIAEAQHRGDAARVGMLYVRSRRLLYAGAAWVSFLLIPFSRELLSWTVGDAYGAAQLTLIIMLLYPIHQALGQLQGTYFYAVGATRAYTAVGLAHMLVSLPVSYFLLASPDAAVPGLGLGSVGLAAKLFVMQLVGVTLSAHLIARMHGWPVDLRYQVTLPLIFGTVAALTRLLLAQLGLPVTPASFLGAALLYVVATLAIVHRHPRLVGVGPDEITTFRRRAWTALSSWR